MSIYFEAIIKCDWDGCKHKARAQTHSSAVVRKAAVKAGWLQKQGGNDYCPKHAGFAAGGQTSG